MKFQIGDKARICGNKGYDSTSWLKHLLEIGREVEITGRFTGWKGYEAYNIKGSSEILLAEELESLK